jgi:rhodanese-related sulfurtransferase
MNKNLIITITVIALVALAALGYMVVNRDSPNSVADTDHHKDEVVKDYEIYPGDVAEKIKNNEDIILLDVRTLEEYEQVHLENALLLPVQELSQQSLAKIGLGENAKDKEIIIYCRSGARSKTAYDIMESLGYTNIKSVAGGMIHWEEDKYPYTEIGEYVPSQKIMENTANSLVPKISFDRTLHDFGVIPQFGGIVETTFTVQNVGKGTLSIGELSTSCGCTSAEISSREIPAGGEAILTVYFDPDLHAEPPKLFKRTVFISSNDPNTPEAELTIQVDIDEGK